MKKYLQAYQDVWQAGYVLDECLQKHIDYHLLIDSYLPDTASFFYVVKFPDGKYNFLGKQQEAVSGYSNEEFQAKGVGFFLENIHPEEVEIVLHKIYPDITNFIAALDDQTKKQVLVQYNYRFRQKNGKYINLLEQVHLLELDEVGRPSVVMGNVIMLQHSGILPQRLTIKQFRIKDVAETIFMKVYSDVQLKHHITKRELEIIRHLAAGQSSREIARQLFISPHTVDTHRRNLLEKLNFRTVVELVRFAFQNAIL